MQLPRLRGLHLFPRLLRPLIPASTYLRLMPDTLICPVYHIARETTPVWWNNRYRIKSIRELEQDLDWLMRLAPPVSLQDLLDWQAGRRDRPRGWFLSFDDGYRELADEVAPLLKRKGIPATFFLCSSLIDNRSVFFEDHAGWIAYRLQFATAAAEVAVRRILERQKTSLQSLLESRLPQPPLLNTISGLLDLDIPAWLKSQQPYLTTSHVQQLLKDGFSIGGHSVTHPLFSEISSETGICQIRDCLHTLRSLSQVPVETFAFPYGEYGLTVAQLRQMATQTDVKLAFGTRGIIADELEPFLLQRMLAEGHTGTFPSHVCRELNLQLQRKVSGRSIVARRAYNP